MISDLNYLYHSSSPKSNPDLCWGFLYPRKNTLMGSHNVVRHQLNRAQQVDTEAAGENGAQQYVRWSER